MANLTRLIDALLAEGIEPFVTLYHWDTPQALEDEYEGWLSPRMERDFLNYADIAFQAFGNRVKKWITLNEPWTMCTLAYTVGIHAPGRCSNREVCSKGNSSMEPYIVAHNMINAHAAVVELYRNKYQSQQEGMIGIALNMDWFEPLRNTTLDMKASERRHEFSFGWFFDPIVFGAYPKSMVHHVGSRLPEFTPFQRDRVKGSFDFLGFNHYSSKYVWHVERRYSGAGWFEDVAVRQSEYLYPHKNDGIIGPQAYSPWLHRAPWGFHKALKWLRHRYGNPFLYVTENGCDDPLDANSTLSDILHDTYRMKYLAGYLASLDLAIQEGSDIRGYFVWSLVDNFEWVSGFSAQFGLYYVNFSDPSRKRQPKQSAAYYSNYVNSHRYNVSSIMKSAEHVRREIWGRRSNT